MANPNTWQAPTSGQPPRAAHVNQLLGPHALTMLYAGAQQGFQAGTGPAGQRTDTQWLAQSFTTAFLQTTIGYVSLPITSTTATSGSQLPPLTLSLYASSGTAPTGSPLVSTTITAEYANVLAGGVPTTNLVFPLPITGLPTATQFWLVTNMVGSSSFHYTWYESDQAGGASTSTNGTSWTAQSYGLLYSVYDQTPTGMPTCTWEDAGARWTSTGYTATGAIAYYAEYTAGQTGAGYVQSARNFAYSGGLLTAVA